jgi:hypothetical protein
MVGRMFRPVLVASVLVLAFCFTVVAARSAGLAVHGGCPPKGSNPTYGMTIAQVVAAARAKVVGEMTHYQGRSARRTVTNTPVSTVFMWIGPSRFSPGATRMSQWARRKCGSKVADGSHAVVFHDSLSVIADAVVVKFVVSTAGGVWVY